MGNSLPSGAEGHILYLPLGMACATAYTDPTRISTCIKGLTYQITEFLANVVCSFASKKVPFSELKFVLYTSVLRLLLVIHILRLRLCSQ